MKTLLSALLALGMLGSLIGCEEGSTVTKPDRIPPPPATDAAQAPTTLGQPVPVKDAIKPGR